MVVSLLQGKTSQFSLNRPKEIREITVSLLAGHWRLVLGRVLLVSFGTVRPGEGQQQTVGSDLAQGILLNSALVFPTWASDCGVSEVQTLW